MRRKQHRLQIDKQSRNRMEIISIANNISDRLAKAYEVARDTIQSEHQEAQLALKAIEEQLKGVELTEDNPPSTEEWTLYDDWSVKAWAIHSSEDDLIVLEEVRVVFLFRAVEIAIKEMMHIAFPNINPKDLYRWDIVKSHLKANGITVGNIPGFQETDSLRIVNNNIKHSSELSEETKRSLPYWNSELEFSYHNLLNFREQVESKIRQFMIGLGEAIIDAAFEFDDSKLDAIASELSERLSSEHAEKLIEKLRSKYEDLA